MYKPTDATAYDANDMSFASTMASDGNLMDAREEYIEQTIAAADALDAAVALIQKAMDAGYHLEGRNALVATQMAGEGTETVAMFKNAAAYQRIENNYLATILKHAAAANGVMKARKANVSR